MGNMPEYILKSLSKPFYILLKYKRHSLNNQGWFYFSKNPTTSLLSLMKVQLCRQQRHPAW